MDGLADLVRRARKRARLTQQELADAVGLSRGYIAQIETGMIGRPSNATIGRLAEVLGVTREQLARAAGIIEPFHSDDARSTLLRIRLLPTPEQRIAALLEIDDELLMLVEDLAVDLAYQSERDRYRQLRARARLQSARGSS